MLQPEMTPEVKTAFDHVREHFPEVTQVFYSVDQKWFYCNDDFEGPGFNVDVDMSLLEAAAASIPYQPIAYAIILE